jgi:hypothetical protein
MARLADGSQLDTEGDISAALFNGGAVNYASLSGQPESLECIMTPRRHRRTRPCSRA